MEKTITKQLSIAVVEDSRPYLKLLSIFLKQIEQSVNVSITIDLYDNPIDYKISRKAYDTVILDYVFRQYTYGANGFYLAKFTKERNPKCFVIVHSSYAKEDVKGMIDEFGQYIDAYSHKESESTGQEKALLEIIKSYARSL